MANSSSISIPGTGMINDIHPLGTDGTTFRFALNMVDSDFYPGQEGFVQNEPSNICSIEFPPNYRVVGYKRINEFNKIIWILVNTETNLSQIGESSLCDFNSPTDSINKGYCSTCPDYTSILSVPLENKPDVCYCEYKIILSSDCLNFSLLYPVDIEYKVTNCTLNLYFTDNNNERRFIYFEYDRDNNLTLQDEFKKISGYDAENCNVPIYEDELDCDKIKFHVEYEQPCVEFIDFVNGGNLKEGTYQAMVSFSDPYGNPVSNYFPATHPAPLSKFYEKVNTNLDTGMALKFKISGLKSKHLYSYYNIVIAETIDQTTTFKHIVTLPTSQTEYTYTGYENGVQVLSPQEVFFRRPYYEKAASVTKANNYLFFSGMTEYPMLNLQPVANKVKLKWATVSLNEDAYFEPRNTAYFKTYQRDESYVFGIVFIEKNGRETCAYPLVGREALEADLEEVTSKDVILPEDCAANCCEDTENKMPPAINAKVKLVCTDEGCSETGEMFLEFQFEKPLPTIITLKIGQLSKISETMVNAFGYSIFPPGLSTPGDSYYYPGQENVTWVDIPEGSTTWNTPFPLTIADTEEGHETWICNNCEYPVTDLVLKVEPLDQKTRVLFSTDQNYTVHNIGFVPEEEDDDDDDCVDCSAEKTDVKWRQYNTAFVETTNDEQLSNCENINIYQTGEFAYTESTDRYPNIPEVWGDLCGQPIRHFKFPDCCVTHIHDSEEGDKKHKDSNKIYPIGIIVDHASVIQALDDAVEDELITQEQRDNISSYRIVRANRVGNKSIVAKGLLFNTWKHNKYGKDYYYPNYPYNDLSPDMLLAVDDAHYKDETKFPNPMPSTNVQYDRYTFHSPDTHFVNPTIGSVLKIETEEYGESEGYFTQSECEAKQQMMSAGTKLTAWSIAIGGWFAERWSGLLDWFRGQNGVLKALMDNLTEYDSYLELFKSFTPFKQYGIQYNSVGKYNNYRCKAPDYKQRLITNSSYLNSYVQNVPEGNITTSSFNNWKRETSVYIKLADSINAPETIDDSRVDMFEAFRIYNPQARYDALNQTFRRDISSYYASIKNIIPNQYGSIYNLEFLETNSCAFDLNKEYTQEERLIFGGDTFISRFAIKRKMPFFTQNMCNIAAGTDVAYSVLHNAGYPSYYYDTTRAIFSEIDGFAGSYNDIWNRIVQKTYRRLDANNYKFFHTDGYIHLYHYGVPYFLVESDVNTNFRHAENNRDKDFYPHNTDLKNWFEEGNVPIETDNTFFYNRTYSRQNKESAICTSRIITMKDFNCDIVKTNKLIYSGTSDTERDADNWLVFKANDFYDFPLFLGKLVSADGIENDKILARLTKGSQIFNAYNTIQATGENIQVGTGGMFQTRPRDIAVTDLGYAGTDHKSIVHTEFGHIWADSKNGNIFNLNTGGEGIDELTKDGEKSFFKENLPFQLKRDFPQIDIDNNLNGIGLHFGFDRRFSRLLVTKLDYKKIDPRVQYNSETNEFFIIEEESPVIIKLSDSRYFCNKSWTRSYNFYKKQWRSFHSYIPNLYVNDINTFSIDSIKPKLVEGVLTNVQKLYTHNLTNKSFQVFCGKLHPFIIEFNSDKSVGSNYLNHIEYTVDVLRYHNEYDYYYVPNITFNKGVVSNNNQSTGVLHFVPTDSNNLNQSTKYPKYLFDRIEILTTNTENTWRFNDIFDMSANNNLPLFLNNCANSQKDLNPQAINYRKPEFQRSILRGGITTVRLINDKHSSYKFIFNHGIINQNQSFH